MAAQSYNITVFGQSFTVTSEKSEYDVRAVAAYVDEKMWERARVTRTIAPLRVAIMAALGIAEELLEQQQIADSSGSSAPTEKRPVH